MNQDTTSARAGAGDATLLLGLDGLAVTVVERSAAGTLLVEVATAAETRGGLPDVRGDFDAGQGVRVHPAAGPAAGPDPDGAGVAQATLVLPCTVVRPHVVHRVDARGPGRRADHDTAAGACR